MGKSTCRTSTIYREPDSINLASIEINSIRTASIFSSSLPNQNWFESDFAKSWAFCFHSCIQSNIFREWELQKTERSNFKRQDLYRPVGEGASKSFSVRRWTNLCNYTVDIEKILWMKTITNKSHWKVNVRLRSLYPVSSRNLSFNNYMDKFRSKTSPID